MMSDYFENKPILHNVDPDENLINLSYRQLFKDGSPYYSVQNSYGVITGRVISVINLNIRSFNRNFDAFQAYLSAANVCPDIIVLTETLAC